VIFIAFSYVGFKLFLLCAGFKLFLFYAGFKLFLFYAGFKLPYRFSYVGFKTFLPLGSDLTCLQLHEGECLVE
jgi:hypothetical protein